MKIKNIFLLALLFVSFAAGAQTTDKSLFSGKLNFYIANDLGRNGYYDQKTIAETMGEIASVTKPEFVVAPGDIHHFDGIQSVHDPLWLTNYELIYKHPELMMEWYPILGNHEYNGNTCAVIDYSNISRRWVMPDRYYTKTFDEKGKTSVRIVWIDTTPMIDKYRTISDKYFDACKQDMDTQLVWLDSVLNAAKEDWVIVAGHHPVYAQTTKDESERTDLQKRLNPILKKYNIDLYVCGHIHNFQHIRKQDTNIDYVINSSGSLARKVSPVDGTQFCSPEPGFSVCTADAKELNLHMMDKDGNIIYSIKREKK